jgi:hypothetical protein
MVRAAKAANSNKAVTNNRYVFAGVDMKDDDNNYDSELDPDFEKLYNLIFAEYYVLCGVPCASLIVPNVDLDERWLTSKERLRLSFGLVEALAQRQRVMSFPTSYTNHSGTDPRTVEILSSG